MSFSQKYIDESQMTGRSFEAFIFDLDGTLLDTLDDLVILTNKTLESFGYPERSTDEIHGAIGEGLRALLQKMAPPESVEDEVDALVRRWEELYGTYGIAQTKEYPGIADLVKSLKAQGKKLGVVSNKFDKGVHDLIPLFFPGIFTVYHGVCEGFPRKPNPQGLCAAIDELGVDSAQVVYIGDSPTDVKTARNAGVEVIAVTWGYRSEEDLCAAQPSAMVNSPEEILRFL